MSDNTLESVSPSLAKILRQFRTLGRELAVLDRSAFTVPECQTRVDLFPEHNADGTLHFFADVNVRQSPTIAAVLAITFSAINDQLPAVALALPPDFVRLLMQDIGLGARESGLSAMVERIKRHAHTIATSSTPSPTHDSYDHHTE